MQEQEQEQELQSQIFQNENGDLSGVSIIRPGLSDIEPELKKAWISLSTSSSNLGFNEVAYWAAHRLFIDDNDFNKFCEFFNIPEELKTRLKELLRKRIDLLRLRIFFKREKIPHQDEFYFYFNECDMMVMPNPFFLDRGFA